jgi:hypothetical protein
MSTVPAPLLRWHRDLVASRIRAEQLFRGPFLHLHPSGFPSAPASATPGAAAAYVRLPGPSFTKR